MGLKNIILIVIIILGPSWTVAYITDKVIYVIPMLAVCTFVSAQIYQNRPTRLDDDGSHAKEDGGDAIASLDSSSKDCDH